MAVVDIDDYEFACLIGKLAKEIGSWGEQQLTWDKEAVEKIHRQSARLAELTFQYMNAEKADAGSAAGHLRGSGFRSEESAARQDRE
jgi:hypothetical protein